MNIRSPFSLYDFIGYFFPGFISIIIFIIYYICSYHPTLDLTDISTLCLNNGISNIIINGSIHIYAIIIILSYIIGHLINYLSSITVEKYSIWTYGYPSNFLLNIDKPRYYKFYERNEVEEWINNPHNNWFYRTIGPVKKYLIESKYPFLQKIACIRIRAFFWRFTLKITLLPITLLDGLIGKFLGLNLYYTNKLDNTIVELINKKTLMTKNKMGIQENSSIDFQRIINHYYYEKFKNHNHRLDNYVSLYGFLRGLALIFSISSILFLFFVNIIIAIIFAIVSYIFYMAFMKFYRRFSLENFMCFLVDDNFDLTFKA